jgi:hypothetical protein
MLSPEFADAGFFNEMAKVAINPTAFVTAQVVKKITGNTSVANYSGFIAAPIGIPSSGTAPAALQSIITSQTTQFIQSAVRAGPESLINIPNPWFFQTVMAIKTLKTRGLLKSDAECRTMATTIADGVAAGTAVAESPALGSAMRIGTQQFVRAACDTSFEQRRSYSLPAVMALMDQGIAASASVLSSTDLDDYAPIDPNDVAITNIPQVVQQARRGRFVAALQAAGLKPPVGACQTTWK